MAPPQTFQELSTTICAMHNFDDEEKIRGIRLFIESSMRTMKNVQTTTIGLLTADQRRDHPMQPIINRPNSTLQTYRSVWEQLSGPVRAVFNAVNKQALLEDMLRDLSVRNLSGLQISAKKMVITLSAEAGAPE